MILQIDGISTDVCEGESLQDIVRRLHLDSDSLKTRPLAAQLAGETFTLGYVPIKKSKEEETRSIRRAIRAAKGRISLIRYEDARGKNVYERTMLFVFLLGMRNLFPDAHVHIDYAVAEGIYATVKKEPEFSKADTNLLLKECKRIVEADYPLRRIRLDVDEAIEMFAADGQTDKVRLLEWRMFPYFDVYKYGKYMDYFYGEMACSTGYVTVFDLHHTKNGVVILRPDPNDFDKPATFKKMPILSNGFKKSADWGKLMNCSVAADLNDLVRNGEIRQLIRVNEALHEKELSNIADRVIKKNAKIVLMAGPSSSGKTTTANRLAIELRVHGKKPKLISMDDYYMDRDKVEKEPDGSIDLEHVKCLDTKLFSKHIKELLQGKEILKPTFDFVVQRRAKEGTKLRLDDDSILLIEGIHGLNPMLLPKDIDTDQIFKLYVSALTTLNLDDHNRIQTTQIRLLRRMVRDYETRGASIERTLSMWTSVRAGEERWIFPFQEQADCMFNSALVYEPVILRKHIYPLLMNVRPDSEWYEEVHALLKFLNYFLDANVEDEIPPTSIVREFIGGNTFYKK
ncbi:MAG: nucleoside kinase [Clostridia bacterium]|nr:nucleoside kinase [Clostridia bacterium]